MKQHLFLGKLLINSHKILKEIQADIEKDFEKLDFKGNLILDFKNSSFKESFKKNFFTMLIISILLESKISRKHIISYGKIIMYLRQIVTSTDNIIDNENKGIVFIKDIKNNVVSNTLITLLCQDFLMHECLKVSEEKKDVSKKILNKIYSIAISESLRDISQYERYPDERYILDKIHSGIGGELLKISFEAPLAAENNLKLEKFSNGIYMIGMSLQALDDFFDLNEDEENGKVNLLASSLIYSNGHENDIRKNYLKKVSEDAYKGFKILEINGFPINRSGSKKLLKKLFELRGLKDYTSILD